MLSFILYNKVNGFCYNCKVDGCLNCSVNFENCLKCVDARYISEDNKCVYCNETGFFVEGGTFCRKCSENCLKCLNDKECLLCKEKFVLNSSACRECINGLEDWDPTKSKLFINDSPMSLFNV